MSELVVGSWSESPLEVMQSSGVSDPEPWLIEQLGGMQSDSGIRVNHTTVLTSGPVYQAVTLLSSDLAALPLEVFKTGETTNKQDLLHPIWRIWNVKANDEMLAFHTRQTLLGWTLLHGNGLGAIEFRNGRPVGVYPLQPGSVWPERLPRTPELAESGLAGEIVYRYTLDNGETGMLFRDEVFHLKLFGNGLWGYSPLYLFQNLFGNGLAMQKFQGKSFANSARPSGILQKEYGEHIPRQVSTEDRANLRREWEDIHSGLDNTGKIAVLVNGLKWVPMSVTNEQAQMIESLKFHREQVAAVYNIPPHKLGAMENSAVRANIEEQNRSYVQQTLMPHARSFEQECADKLCSTREKTRMTCFVRFNFKELLRADHKTRYEAYATGRQWGWLSANDILRLEDMDEIGVQGDIYMVPSNMANAETGEPFAISTQPPSESTTTTEPSETEDQDAFFAYAREQMCRQHAIEIRHMRKGVGVRNPEAYREKFYAKFSHTILDALRPLASVNGVVDETKIAEVVDAYVLESQALMQTATTDAAVFDVAMQFPRRLESVITQLRAVK